MNGWGHTRYRKIPKIMSTSVLARIPALLLGAARPPMSRNGRAAVAIVPQMACMQDPQEGDLPGYFHENQY
ncbi:MAG: hypothetical protein CVV32_10935 [Methanomicrobiales archaeon HGW-Methanomicrobiales-3]|nr:MAG: hypothetical protein CVV32_10935 [Methanomicrobiales archaeon HGW-Methanomicrobiales-3]